jgi:RimJ/RimL family protein N-acetyltransferase
MSGDVSTDLADWAGCAMPDAPAHQGVFVRLERLDPARHGAALYAAFSVDDGVWNYLPYGPFGTVDAFNQWLEGRASERSQITHAVIDVASGQAVGLVSLMEIRAASGVVEVGHVAFSKVMQRTRLGSEALYLLADYVFGLGYRRFEWKCDTRNAPSQAAAQRFGFVPEGVFRQHLVVKGRNRDTAWFSILDGEWPALAAAYRHWLAPENFGPDGAQRMALSALVRAARG